MSKLYLHEKNLHLFTTTKDTIIADLDELDGKYCYKRNIMKKNPSELIITGAYSDDFTNASISNLPVKKVTFNIKKIDSHATHLNSFSNCTILNITNKCEYVDIICSYGLEKLEHIILPFNIKFFRDEKYFNNKINNITIYNKKERVKIDLENNFINKETIIETIKKEDKLIINISSKEITIEYTVYKENNKLFYNKKILNKKINTNCKELNLLELNKLYDYNLDFKKIECERLILSKEELKLISKNLIEKNKLKEIEILDNNEMLLIPKKISIKTNINEYIEGIEEYGNDKGIFFILIRNHITNTKRYIIINKKLEVVEIPICINELVFDCDVNNFNYDENLKRLTLPVTFDNFLNTCDKSLLYSFTKYYDNKVYLKQNNEIIELLKTSFIWNIHLHNEEKQFGITYFDSTGTKRADIKYSFNPNDYCYYKNIEYQKEIENKLIIFESENNYPTETFTPKIKSKILNESFGIKLRK